MSASHRNKRRVTRGYTLSPVSLHPLDFETALAAALKTGKPIDSKKKKMPKKGAKLHKNRLARKPNQPKP